MYTKKQVLMTCCRLSALIGICICLLKEEGWFVALLYFCVLTVFFFIIPAILEKLLLKKDEQEEVDGEIFLFGGEEGKIEYHLTINDPTHIPFKDYLKIRVNENAREK